MRLRSWLKRFACRHFLRQTYKGRSRDNHPNTRPQPISLYSRLATEALEPRQLLTCDPIFPAGGCEEQSLDALAAANTPQPSTTAPTWQNGTTLGNVASSSLTEISGIAASRQNSDVLWVHNDSGDSARIFAMNTQGDDLGVYNLSGAGAVDWEDIAIGPGPLEGQDYLYVGDFGDNARARSSITVYRLAEPIVDSTSGAGTVNLGGVEALHMQYPDTVYDCETLMVDPLGGDLYLVTKDRAGEDMAHVFRTPADQAAGSTVTLEFVESLAMSSQVTGGDISADGTDILIRQYHQAYYWSRDAGDDLGDVLAGNGEQVPLDFEMQGEAIGFSADDRSYFSVSEGSYQPIHYYQENHQPGSISGHSWNDTDSDSVWDSTESGLSGRTIYIDANANRQLDTGEVSMLTDVNGQYHFDDLEPGTYTIAELYQPNWIQTYPSATGEYEWSETTFDWADISAIGTELNLGDDDYSQAALPFLFPFYGQDKSTVRISSNGYLTFGSAATDYTNDPIPTPSQPNDLIAGFWDDLNPSQGGSIYYYSDSTTGEFCVQYQDVPHYPAEGAYTFQTILKADGSIKYQYHSLNGNHSATIGIENADGSEGLEISYNDTFAQNGTAVQIASSAGESLPHIVTIGWNDDIEDRNFGNIAISPGTLSGGVWLDANNNGVWDASEQAMANETVYLDIDESGNLNQGDLEATTDTTGSYAFTVAAGTYDVRLLTQASHSLSVPASGYFAEVQLSNGGVAEGLLFGLVLNQPGSISGYKWNDTDGDGLWDSGEVGLSGWTVYIDANQNGSLDTGELSTVTEENGFYSFGDLQPGSYTVGEVLQSGWMQTYPDSLDETPSSLAQMADLTTPEILADAHYTDQQLIVKLRDETDGSSIFNDLRSLQASLGATTLESADSLGFELWSIDGDVKDVIRDWGDEPSFQYIQPNYTITLDATVPDDSNFNSLWGLNNTGQTGGVADADIDASEAWDLQTGNNVVVGVIDTGIDYTHPDLIDNMWVNPGEIAGNGLDDDSNGYIDDVYGYDFAYGDGDPYDGHSHGTHVAGTIAASGNNGQGVVGVNWDAQLMALKFLSDSGSGSTMNAILAVDYATMMGVRVTNNSWGGGGYSQALLQRHRDRGSGRVPVYRSGGQFEQQ